MTHKLETLGQLDALIFADVTIEARHGLVEMMVSGPDGNAYATMSPDLAQALIGAIRQAIREAASQTPLPEVDPP